MAPPDPRSETS